MGEGWTPPPADKTSTHWELMGHSFWDHTNSILNAAAAWAPKESHAGRTSWDRARGRAQAIQAARVELETAQHDSTPTLVPAAPRAHEVAAPARSTRRFATDFDRPAVHNDQWMNHDLETNLP